MAKMTTVATMILIGLFRASLPLVSTGFSLRHSEKTGPRLTHFSQSLPGIRLKLNLEVHVPEMLWAAFDVSSDAAGCRAPGSSAQSRDDQNTQSMG